MDDDLFTYEEKIPKLPYLPNVEKLMNELNDGNLDVHIVILTIFSVAKMKTSWDDFKEFNRLSGMDDDLFTYEEKIPKLPYLPNVEKLMNELNDGNLDVHIVILTVIINDGRRF
ncbi:hypothetical protein Tco_1534772 [Tanacetum coccineum]